MVYINLIIKELYSIFLLGCAKISLPFISDSLGPPLLQAITGFSYAIASMGTMPKCSLVGVYTTTVLRASRFYFSFSVTDLSRYI